MDLPRKPSRATLFEMIGIVVIVLAAFSTRLLPLSMSQYPYNNDAITECVSATGILSTGHLGPLIPTDPVETTHSTAIPGFNVLLAFVAGAIGVTPYQSAQFVTALVAVLTVLAIYILAKMFSGSPRGGFVASFIAIFFGTFLFTTGSSWKEALGIGLMALAILAFSKRGETRYRVLCVAVLMVLPVVHHLVAVITLLATAFPVTWALYFGLHHGTIKARHASDILTILVPAAWTGVYYWMVSLDRFESTTSPLQILLVLGAFGFLLLLTVVILRMKTHVSKTLAPFPGLGLMGLLMLDYSGMFFSYNPSSPGLVIFLMASFVLLFSIAWYGTELAIEKYQMYRAVQVGLLFAPVTIIGYGLFGGLNSYSLQIIYRTFDFVDFFIFMGCGIAMVHLWSKRKRLFHVVGAAVIALVLITFPFGFYTGQFLGVRHDTQAYEVDALNWLSESGMKNGSWMQSDERIAYVANSMFGFVKNSGLPSNLMANISWPPHVYHLYEESWITDGVNNFPHGEVLVPWEYMTKMTAVQNVVYVGGPVDDRLIIFEASGPGENLNGWYLPETNSTHT